MIIGTAGHIDHGKSTLVRALTGVDPDRLPAEKARGITIELGFAPVQLGPLTASFVDVPGHEAFVRTMVAGAAGIDVALLVVAADDGIRPQTREHLAILGLLGVSTAVVAVTKSDRASAARLAEVHAAVAAMLAPTPLAGAPVIPVSALTGEGLGELREALAAACHLVEPRADSPFVRLPVDRVFSVAGSGTVVTGTLWSGAVAPGDALVALPAGRPLRVRGVQVHGHAVERALAGERTALALAGVDRTAVQRGDVLVAGAGWEATRVLRADVWLLDEADVALTPRTRVRVHLGTQDVGGRIVAKGGVHPGAGVVAARIVVDAPLVARGGDRIVLRRPSPAATIGGGVVTDAAPAEPRVRPFAAPGLDVVARLDAVIAEARLRGVVMEALPLRLGVSRAHLEELLAAGRAWSSSDGRVVSLAAVTAARQRLYRWLGAWHTEHPSLAGAPLAAAREALGAPAALARDLLEHDPAIIVDGASIRLATFTPARDVQAEDTHAALCLALTAAGFAIPSARELEPEFGARTGAHLRALQRSGEAVLVGHDRWTTPGVVRAAARRLAESLVPLRDYTASELREIFGISRKYLIPWLEYCDREGFTLRHGDHRRLGARAAAVGTPVS